MKKIFRFTAPDGEFVKWGEFDNNKKVLTIEVEKYTDDGDLIEKESIDFTLPEDLGLKSNWTIRSSTRTTRFKGNFSPEQTSAVQNKKEILTD